LSLLRFQILSVPPWSIEASAPTVMHDAMAGFLRLAMDTEYDSAIESVPYRPANGPPHGE
jgi:hypothetical protein